MNRRRVLSFLLLASLYFQLAPTLVQAQRRQRQQPSQATNMDVKAGSFDRNRYSSSIKNSSLITD